MRKETKDKLGEIAQEKRYTLGDTIEFLLKKYESDERDTLAELLRLEKQNKKLLSVIEEHAEISEIMFNALAKTMELRIPDSGDSLALIQAKDIFTKRKEKRIITAVNRKKYTVNKPKI